MSTRALILLLLGLTACAPRMRIPGPVHAMGQRPLVDEDVEAAVRIAAGIVEGEVHASSTSRRRGRPGSDAEAIAAAARRMVGKQRLVVGGESYRADCSGFVAAAYAAGGHDIGGSSADMWERARDAGVLHRRKSPEVGDLAFFDDTYDKNRNGRRDDPLTHVAVVEAIADDGTIVLVHYGSKGVARITMDLRQPDVHIDEQGILRNSYVRAAGKGKRLAGELFRDFGSLWKLGPES